METKVSQNQKEKRDESNTGMQTSTDDVISGPGSWSPLTFLRGDMSATGQDPAPGETSLGRGRPHEQRDSQGEHITCPWVGPVSLGSLNVLSWRSNSKVQIPEPDGGSGKLAGSKVATTVTGSLHSEQSQEQEWLLNLSHDGQALPHSPTYLPQPLPSHNGGLKRSNAKDMDLQSGDLAGVALLSLSHMWC